MSDRSFADKLFRLAKRIAAHSPAMRAGIRDAVCALALVTAVGGFPPAASANSGGARVGYSGDQLAGEQVCTACHQGQANSGSGTLDLLINDAPAAQHVYTPGATIQVVVKAHQTGAARFGFQFTARTGNGCTQGGVLTAATGLRVREGQGTGPCAATPGTLQWITHSRPQNGDSADFRFDWTAPPADSGPVQFAVAVVAANGNLSPTGDSVYSQAATLAEQGPPPLGPPAILSENGVVLGDWHTATPRGAPGALAVVRGTDFVAAAGEQWLASNNDATFPTKLGGSCVKVNRMEAPLKLVSPSRIDFQIPWTTTIGTATVQVFRDCGQPSEAASNEVAFTIAAVQPALLWRAATPAAVAAEHADRTPIGPQGLLPGIDTSPAAPGEIVSLFATGFGQVSPALSTGQVSREDRATVNRSVEVSVGGRTVPAADLRYVGAAPGFLGTYRLDVRVPSELEGRSYPVSVKVGNVTSPAGPMLLFSEAPDASQAPLCTLSQTLLPGQSCKFEVEEVEVEFQVKSDGSAVCASVPLRNWTRCSSMSVEVPRYRFEAAPAEGGGWRLSKLN